MAIISEQAYIADGTQRELQVVGTILSDSHIGVWIVDYSTIPVTETRLPTAHYDVLGSTVLLDVPPQAGLTVSLVLTDNGEGIEIPPSEITDISANIDKIINVSNNINNINYFVDRYLGDRDIKPTTRLDGSSLQEGDLYFDKTIQLMRVYSNDGWKVAYASTESYTKSEIENLFVGVSGDQVIEDIKTFTSSPRVPTPTAGSQAVNKVYVDSQMASKTAEIVKTIADLKKITGNSAEVLGYYTKGDGGGGLFYWDSTSTETDNGGTIIQATGVTTGRWKRVYRDSVNVKWFGAKGDGATDDTVAIQKAIDYCIANRKQEVYIPSNKPAMYYKVTDTIKIVKHISLKGDGQNSTTLMAIGFTLNKYVLDFDMDIAATVHFSQVSDLTVRSLDKYPIGARISNISYLSLKNTQFFGLRKGIEITGTRTFSNTFREVTFHDITQYAVHFKSFSGGGHYLFDSCTLNANDGFVLDDTSATNSLVFSNCNFEQCVSSDIIINGIVNGLTITGCRSEGFDGNYSFMLNPATGKYVNGINITGCFWTADSGNATPIYISGIVNGFTIQGNSAGYIGYRQFVYLNGAGEAGVISGNYCANSPKVVNVNRPGVVVFNNKNSSGDLPDYTKEIGVNQTWQDVTSSRTPGVTYTNDTGKPIMCIYSFGSAGDSGGQGITVGGVLIRRPSMTGATLEHTITAIVPNNVTYSYSTTDYPANEKRYELR